MSNQNVATPLAFVKAVEALLHIEFKYDMAAEECNKKAPVFVTKEQDALSMDWPLDGWLWLNPPFKSLSQWIKKCKEQQARGCKIVSVWPLSSDLNQIDTWSLAQVYVLHGRIWKLEVRSCMLCVWDAIELRHMTQVTGLRWDGATLAKVW